MATPSEALKALNKAIDSYTDRYLKALAPASEALFKEASRQIEALQSAGGSLRTDTANINAVNQIVSNLQRYITTGPYGKATGEFLTGFTETTVRSAAYFEAVGLAYGPDVFTQALQADRIAQVESTLLGTGLNSAVMQPIRNVMLTNLQSRASLEDLREALRQQIIPSGGTPVLERYAGTYADTAIATYNAAYLQDASQNLGIEYYRYDGSVINSTRPFCKRFVNQYFSKKEIERLGEGKQPFGGGNLPDTELDGRIAGTNAQTIFTLRGGWNCRHRFVPVPKTQVPTDVLERNNDKLG